MTFGKYCNLDSDCILSFLRCICLKKIGSILHDYLKHAFNFIPSIKLDPLFPNSCTEPHKRAAYASGAVGWP